MLAFASLRPGRSPAATVFAVVAGLFCALTSFADAKTLPPEDWTTYRNPRFGYILTYPSRVFTPHQPSEDGGGEIFLTKDERAKIVVYGALNDEHFTPSEYRKTILEKFSGYDQIDYSPQGKTWFVLSGYRGDKIYYQKVMF